MRARDGHVRLRFRSAQLFRFLRRARLRVWQPELLRRLSARMGLGTRLRLRGRLLLRSRVRLRARLRLRGILQLRELLLDQRPQLRR